MFFPSGAPGVKGSKGESGFPGNPGANGAPVRTFSFPCSWSRIWLFSTIFHWITFGKSNKGIGKFIPSLPGFSWTSRCSRIPWRKRRSRWCHHSERSKRRERWHRLPWTTWSSRSRGSAWSWRTTWSSRTKRSSCKWSSTCSLPTHDPFNNEHPLDRDLSKWKANEDCPVNQVDVVFPEIEVLQDLPALDHQDLQERKGSRESPEDLEDLGHLVR